MSTKKAGLVLTILGLVIFLASLLVDYAGAGDRRLGASQILGMEMGVALLLCGIYLVFLYPDHEVSLGNGIRAGLARLFHLPVSAWVLLGFLIVYFFFFLSPVFFNPERSILFISHYIPTKNPIGLDIRAVMSYMQDWVVSGQSPYADGFIAYPPLSLLLLTPLLLVGYPAYYYVITLATLLFYLCSTLLVPSLYTRGRDRSLVLLLFALGLFSYGFQFELERGQQNIIAFSLALVAVYLFHARDDLDLLAFLLFSIGVQMKIYPAILIVLFIRDWKDWKGNAIRMTGLVLFNIVLLFIMGFPLFSGFLGAVRGQQLLQATWNGNHSLKGYVFELAAGRYEFFGPSLLSLFKAYQGQVELLLLAVLGLALLSVFLFSHWKGGPGLNPYLLVICTVCAMVIPSVSNDYKLPILIAPMAMLWGSISMPEGGGRRLLSILLVLITAAAYWSLQYPARVKPDFLDRNFPALFVILIAVAALSFVAPWQPRKEAVQIETPKTLAQE